MQAIHQGQWCPAPYQTLAVMSGQLSLLVPWFLVLDAQLTRWQSEQQESKACVMFPDRSAARLPVSIKMKPILVDLLATLATRQPVAETNIGWPSL